jgi:hypothetical protein
MLIVTDDRPAFPSSALQRSALGVRRALDPARDLSEWVRSGGTS